MSNLMTLSNNKMMSSKEIAELTGKRHADVIRDIRNMIGQLDGADLRHEQYQSLSDERGYTSEVLLDHDLTMLLLTGYDVKARLKVIQRWKELEQKTALPNFTDPAESAIAWANEYKAKQLAIAEVEKQKAIIEQQAPKAEFHDRFVNADGLHNVRQTAKVLGIPEKQFVKRAIDSGVLYRTNRVLTGYEKWVKAGYVTHKEEEHGGKARPQVMFTPKGIAWIGKRIIKTEQQEVLTVDCKQNTVTQPPHLAALAALGMVKSAANSVGV